jgi:bacillithiol system protein YtxJ
MTWNQLISVEQLDALLAESTTQPVAIFKHSTRCSISATAKARLERQWVGAVGEDVKLYLLDLLRYRPISNDVATHLRVSHESPQLLLIQNGVCTYDGSHLDIRLDAVRQQVS